MDAHDSSAAWDLRCFVREKLIQFLQEKYPNALPKIRAELQGPPEEAIAAAICSTPICKINHISEQDV
jgi:hypothetical protein